MGIIGNNRNYKIAVLICYFGKEPWYFKYFLWSCRFNSSVDIILISDIQFKDSIPDNVTVHKKSLDDIRLLCEKQLLMPIALDRAYKLCDLKPAYGIIFKDLIKGYDFWGHGDCDVIYGNIRRIITDAILKTNDIICVRQEYVTGFFTLFRNNETCNNLFRESPDYIKVFQSNTNYCFDECNYQFEALVEGKSIFEVTLEIEPMTLVIQKKTNEGKIKSFFETIVVEDIPGDIEWHNGNLYYNKEEVLLYHLIKFKKELFKFLPSWRMPPKRYFIESFYFSKYQPNSKKGKTLSFLLHAWRHAFLLFTIIGQFFQWTFEYCLSRKKLDYLNKKNVSKIIGTYKLEDFTVHIFEDHGSLFASWKKNKKNQLLVRKQNKFMLSKFNESGFINTKIEFYFNEDNKELNLRLISFGCDPFILLKQVKKS